MNDHQQPAPDAIFADRINEIVMGFQKSRVLLTAYELDLFTALGGESKTSVETAALLGTDPRATDRLMNALCALQLLDKKENKFSNSLLTKKFLVKGSPHYMGGLQHRVHLWDSWSTLTQAVQKGRSVIEEDINDRDGKWLSAFIAAMHGRAKIHAPVVAAKLDLSNVLQVLDVGGGSGAFAMAIVKAKEGLNAAVFDLPNVIPLTRKYIEKEGLTGKVSTIEGDYSVDALGSGYDLVFLSAVIHSNSMEGNIELLKKCAAALNPGGQVVVQDFIMDEDRTTPASGTLFALNMLVGTKAGDTFTESEVSDWMKKAGLSGIKRIDMPFGTALIIGRKKE